MDKQTGNKMPKPFEDDQGSSASASASQSMQFVLREDDRLKQEEDYRQGSIGRMISRRKILIFLFQFRIDEGSR